MAFIKNTERESLIKKVNKSYGFRKFLITAEIILLIGFIVMTFVSGYFWGKQGQEWAVWYDQTTNKLQPLGIGMLVWACVIVVFGLVALILTWTLKSPKDVKKEINKLETSALSGKKVKRSQTATDVIKTRTTVKENKKK